MQIAVIIKHGYVNEVIVPDSSVKVIVIDGDDPMGTDTVTVAGTEACLDSAAIVKHTTDPERLAALLQEFKTGLLGLEMTNQVAAVLSLLEGDNASA